MSDTDDTDALLLIPPDFYVIESSDSESKSYGPCFDVVNTLINHVTRLEGRVNHLASLSDTSKLCTSLDSHLNSFQMSNPSDLNYPTSTQSTPQKPRGKQVSSSLPTTPSTDRFSPRKSRQFSQRKSKLDLNQSTSSNSTSPDKPCKEKLLEEVDKFITNVKTLQKLSVPKNLTNEFSKSSRSSEMEMKDVDRMLQEMELQQQDIESKLRQKESEILKDRHGNNLEQKMTQTRTWNPGENKNSTPDLHMGMRDIMYGAQSSRPAAVEEPCVKKTVAGKVESARPRRYADSIIRDQELNDTSISSNDSTQITAYQNIPPNMCHAGSMNQYDSNRIVSPDSQRIHSNAIQVLHMHKNSLHKTQDERSSRKNSRNSDELSSDRMSGDFGLINLAELWGQKSSLSGTTDFSKGDSSKMMYKLEEERLRRQHCEQLITELQTRILEQQQKLAVAIEVDSSKDEVIAKFRDAWEKVGGRIQALQRENNNLEQRCGQIQSRCSAQLTDANNKVSHFEREASKALDLAHANQDKFYRLDLEKQNLCRQIEELQKTVHEIKLKMSAEMERSGQLTEVLAHKEIETNKNKQVLADAQRDVQQSKKAVDLCQVELAAMKTEYNNLLVQLEEQKAARGKIESDKHEVTVQLKESRQNGQMLLEEIDKLKVQMESSKLELRSFYQEQVETVVKEKLQEFQQQLQVAEQNLQEEMRKREHNIAHSAAQHMCQLSQQNKMEIKLLEEKYSEEIKLYEIKLSQAHKNIETLVAKFKSQQEKRNTVAQQLQKVMEAQWYEAMKIINSNGKSPIVTQESSCALEQLNSLKSTSFSNIQEMLTSAVNDEPIEGASSSSNAFKGNAAALLASAQNSTSSMIEEDNYQYQSKKSVNQKVPVSEETPVSSRAPIRNQQKQQQQQQTAHENDIQKYIQLLLNKAPGQPLVSEASSAQQARYGKERSRNVHQETPTSDKYLPAWQNPRCDEEDERQNQNFYEDNANRGCKGAIREQRPGKPPWK